MTGSWMLQFQLKKPPRQAINLSAILLAFVLSLAHGREVVTAVSTTTKAEDPDDDPAPGTYCPCFPCGPPCVPVYYPPPPLLPPPLLPPPPPLPPQPPLPLPPLPLPPQLPCPPPPPPPPYFPPRPPYYPPPLWPWPKPYYYPGTYPEQEDNDSSGARLSYLLWFPAWVAAALLLMWS